MRLKKDEFVPYAPAHTGKVRANHVADHCSGGSDSLLVERKEDGNISAYCFRCGGSGYHSTTRHFKSGSTLVSSPVSGHAHVVRASPPDDHHDNFGGFPREVREWLMKGGITPVISKSMGFSWSDKQSKLWIECRQYSKTTTGHKLNGYIVRGFNPKSYLTRAVDKDTFFGYYVTNSVINNTKIVIVEDILSSIKCSQVVDSIAILGVHPKPAIIQHILDNKYKEAYIFLDADNPQVRMKAREIPKRLPFMNCHIIETGSDPKYLQIEKIQELIK